jgi:hypothetical protein
MKMKKDDLKNSVLEKDLPLKPLGPWEAFGFV